MLRRFAMDDNTDMKPRQFTQLHLPLGQTLPDAEWARRHRGILALLWSLAAILPLYGVARGHALAHDLASGAMLLAIAVVAKRCRGRRALSSALTSYGLCLASAIAVHLSDGAIEAHFMFFVMIIVVSLYEDWRPFLIAFGFVVVHHGVMGVLDRSSVYDHAGNPWLIALVHGGFVAAAGVACVVSWRCNEDVRAECASASERAGESDARFRSAFEDGPVGMALVEISQATGLGTLQQVNRTLCAQFGYGESALAGCDIATLLSPASAADIGADIVRLGAGEIAVAHREAYLLHRDGHDFEGRLSMSLVGAAPGESRDLIVQIEDVTERNQLKHELQDLADHDPLTGLLNRRRFGIEMTRRLGAGPRHGGAVLLLDLDGFKEVNDTVGHEAGDRLLTAVAAALQTGSRASDTVARLGGDEFAVLIDEASARDAKRVGERMLDRLHERAVIGDGAGARRPTASMGIIVYSARTRLSGDQLLNDADLAMYEAKAGGGARCVVYCADAPDPGAAQGNASWPDRIRRALDEERFVMYAQPMLDLHTGEVTNFELLLRMVGPDGEIIPPGAFLPVAERRGMIRTIDRWVIRQAVDLLADLTKTGDDERPLHLHVNISGRSLSDTDFLAYIRAELVRSGIDARRLVFEITETAAIGNLDDACRFLTSLADLGCGIALDDFGAGFGSLHYLKNLPIDYLKIDGQFIQNLTTNPDDLVVVDSLVRMSRGLRMRTTAEYIEDAATLKLVRDLGVDFAQGYHVGRPGPARDVIEAARGAGRSFSARRSTA
jgi:diguanylate cyclase (GGDEF)-like protein/PAS domain S-box-containing protein